jgi:hypothetical protein
MGTLGSSTRKSPFKKPKKAPKKSAERVKLTLPVKGTLNAPDVWTKLGFSFGKSDRLFVEAEAPAGWKLSRTEHSYYQDLLDDQGRKRASMFYKAAHYDEDAFIRLLTRFQMDSEREDEDVSFGGLKRGLVRDTATGKVVFKGPWVDQSFEVGDAARYSAIERETYDPPKEWLKQNKPDHEDPTAYW